MLIHMWCITVICCSTEHDRSLIFLSSLYSWCTVEVTTQQECHISELENDRWEQCVSNCIRQIYYQKSRNCYLFSPRQYCTVLHRTFQEPILLSRSLLLRTACFEMNCTSGRAFFLPDALYPQMRMCLCAMLSSRKWKSPYSLPSLKETGMWSPRST